MKRTRLNFGSREQWLAARSEGIGASEVATIVGLNPYETPYQLWRRKVGLDAPKAENVAMQMGHVLEDAVAQRWAETTGKNIIAKSKVDFMFVDADKPFLRVSPDRTFWLGESRRDDDKGILECKSTAKVIDPDDIPQCWFCQVQMNLGVAGYTKGSLAWISAAKGFEFGYKDIDLVSDFFEWLKDETSRFWVDNIIGKKEPELTTAADILLKYPQEKEGMVVEASQEVYAAAVRAYQCRRELKKIEEEEAEAIELLKLAMGDAEKLTANGETLATWRAAKPSAKFDAKRFCAEHPQVAEAYTTETPGSRRFLLKIS